MRSAVDTVMPYIEARRHALRIALPREPVALMADPTRLAQVFSNLLHNAAKFTPPGGRIDVTGEVDGGEVVVRVSDNGIGIAPELLPRVFDLFVQGPQALDRSRGGLGLGLTLVKRLAELHGGSVSASSAGEGQGSEFVVRLPALAEPLPAGPLQVQPPAIPNRRRVLIVEDSEDARESLRLLLELTGHLVETCGDGTTGLAKLRAFRPDVALIDLGLPGMDGYTLARRAREEPETSGIHLVALTGYGQAEDRQRARAAGFDVHLTKPVDPRALQDVLGVA
jgi:CheY-like chemotaxis protein